ncbi:MAG: hypothetical protein AB7E55_32550 [Pigmentiphaga sp.]
MSERCKKNVAAGTVWVGRRIITQDILEAIEAAGFIVGHGEFITMLGWSIKGQSMLGSDGRNYEGIQRTEPFQPRTMATHHSLIVFALYGLRRNAIAAGNTASRARIERALRAWNAQTE